MTVEQLKANLTIDAVVTLPEIVEMWGKSRKSIEMQIYKERLIARKAGGTWLVAKSSVVTLWGNPLTNIVKDA